MENKNSPSVFNYIIKYPSFMKSTINDFYKKNGELEFKKLMIDIPTFPDAFSKEKKEIIDYCNLLLEKEKNWFYKGGHFYLKLIIILLMAFILALLGLIIGSIN